tara:strand:+ start:238 stop:651 length:414 start_codon:yes stop_codon:yes gene_type:complete
LIKKITDKDKEDWINFISKDEPLIDKDINQIKEKIFKSVSFDLHGYSLEEANDKIRDIIINSYNKNVKKLKIITGKGLHSKNENNPYVSKDLGILRYSVPNFIENQKELISKIENIEEASVEDGGSGAFYIFLKKKL